MLKNNYKDGFYNYEWRLKEKTKKEYRYNNLIKPQWKGEDLDHKVILIISEQGLGDIIQFSRYIFDLKNRYNVKIIFQTHKKLFHIFENKGLNLISKIDILPYHDYFIYLLSLPKLYFELNKELLGEISYIGSNKKNYNKWKNILTKFKSPLVGINWCGSQKVGKKDKSIPFDIIKSLFKLPNIEFLSLQKEEGEKDLVNYKSNKNFYNFSNIIDKKNYFEDTVEIIKFLDLVITNDTSVAHLSATLGLKTWILLEKNPDWRWFLKNNKSPWYKSVRLFRQKKRGDWDNLVKEIKIELLIFYKQFNK